MSGRPTARDSSATQTASSEPAALAEDEIIFSAKRSGPDGASTDVFRVALRSFNGKRYVDLRVYFRADTGELLPTKKGVSVRLSELDGVADALLRASAKLGARR